MSEQEETAYVSKWISEGNPNVHAEENMGSQKTLTLTEEQAELHDFFTATEREVTQAFNQHGPFNSLHEGYAVLLEEFDELWDEVRKRRRDRSPDDIAKELVQIAAMSAKLYTFLAHDYVRYQPT